ncbi:30S ribosomal protein S4, partial [candidate division KSB1 bacterium]|nr:30S ribosomal protein S4 [candidate division KSB1 bacterium]NIW72643.1 30S ribosomal protein S4 [candidate division KSB1 bacterium]NIX74014.1 30S ribosomal protein S4 [candidate division KSB1 bacterium]
TKSEYGQQLLEKQKVRYTYGVGEKQFARYVAGAAKTSRGASPVEKLYASLELRLDNAA